MTFIVIDFIHLRPRLLNPLHSCHSLNINRIWFVRLLGHRYHMTLLSLFRMTTSLCQRLGIWCIGFRLVCQIQKLTRILVEWWWSTINVEWWKCEMKQFREFHRWKHNPKFIEDKNTHQSKFEPTKTRNCKFCNYVAIDEALKWERTRRICPIFCTRAKEIFFVL